MYEFWYNQVKPKHGEKAKTMLHGKIKLLQSTQKQKTFTQILKKDDETRCNTSNYELERQLPRRKNKKVVGLIKDELNGKIIAEFAALRPKTYSFNR